MEKNKNTISLYSAISGSKENTGAVTYTCLMHSEVTSGKPGKCPKCGMELVKKN